MPIVVRDALNRKIGRQPALGEVHGQLTCVNVGTPGRDRRIQVRCTCGTELSVRMSNWRNGGTSSCGCSRLENPSHRTHGQSKSPEWQSWKHAKSRCTNIKADPHGRYVRRGIAMCNRWFNSFEAFLADMGPRPSSKHTLDRFPDNDGDYEPGNCRWATRAEQARNTCSNVLVSVHGEVVCVAEACRRLGLPPAAVYTRLHLGWPVEKAVFTPINRKFSHK